MSNFTFLPADYRSLAEAAKTAESWPYSAMREGPASMHGSP